MAIDVIFRAPGATSGSLGALTNLLDARATIASTRIGNGGFSFHMDNPDASLVQFNRLAFLRDNGTIVEGSGFEIHTIDISDVNDSEDAGKVVTVGGPGLPVLLGTSQVGGATILPACGDIGGFTDGQRNYGWMACCCFDAAGHGFAAPAKMIHRQDDPKFPFEPEEPAEWPDGAANRLYGGKLGTVTPGANEVQRITLGSSIISGYFTLVFDGQETANITAPWSAGKVKAALDAIIDDGSVSVTGAGIDSNPYFITFNGGSVMGRNVGRLKVNHENLNHPPQTSVVTTVTGGTKGNYKVPAGVTYLRKTFTTTTEQELIAFINMSRTGEVYLDGVEIYSQRAASQAKSTQSIAIQLPPGDHCIAAKVEKEGEGGLAWFMMTLAAGEEQESGGWEIGPAVVRTDATWQVLFTAYDATPPGMNVGEIMACAIDEAQDPGNFTAPDEPDLTGITYDFTTAVDSGSSAWTTELNHGFAVGTGLLDVLDELVELAGGIYYTMSSGLVLSITQDPGVDRTGTVVLSRARDTGVDGGLQFLTYSGEAPKASTMLVRSPDDVNFGVDAAAVTAINSRRIGVNMGTSHDFKSLQDFVTAAFAELGEAWGAVFVPTPSGPLPGTDFTIFDLVTLPSTPWTATTWKIGEIQVQMRDESTLFWTVAAIEA